ncbi:MAG: carbon-nitrogen hydrolase family protein [Thermomicrobiales bacterium]
MTPDTWRIGLASPRVAATREAGLAAVERFLAEAAAREVALVCFPETYLPGYRGPDFPATPLPDQEAQEQALQDVCALARRHRVAAIVPMEWTSPAGLLNAAFVVDAAGTVLGCQTKNQVAPEEEPCYVPGDRRRLFVVDGVPFGIVICHEGWRYPETVRWAARRGARVVFHPHLAGSDQGGPIPRSWGEPSAPYFENAMIARAMENTVYFASVNYALRYPETATSLVAPDGQCVAHLDYGEEGLLVGELNLTVATGLYAQRYAPARYGE